MSCVSSRRRREACLRRTISPKQRCDATHGSAAAGSASSYGRQARPQSGGKSARGRARPLRCPRASGIAPPHAALALWRSPPSCRRLRSKHLSSRSSCFHSRCSLRRAAGTRRARLAGPGLNCSSVTSGSSTAPRTSYGLRSRSRAVTSSCFNAGAATRPSSPLRWTLSAGSSGLSSLCFSALPRHRFQRPAVGTVTVSARQDAVPLLHARANSLLGAEFEHAAENVQARSQPDGGGICAAVREAAGEAAAPDAGSMRTICASGRPDAPRPPMNQPLSARIQSTGPQFLARHYGCGSRSGPSRLRPVSSDIPAHSPSTRSRRQSKVRLGGERCGHVPGRYRQARGFSVRVR